MERNEKGQGKGQGSGASHTSRRAILKAGVATAAVATIARPALLRAAGETIRIGHVAPQTGPMAGFAEAQDWVLADIRKYLEKGLEIGGKTWKVEIITKDSQTDESRASEVANDLILKDKVDIITASSGSIDCNPVANAAELNEVPCVTADDPWESYYYGRGGTKDKGFEWTYHFFWGLDQVLSAFIVVDPGQFPAFGNDFTPQITAFKKGGVEIVTGNLFTPDYALFSAQCAQQGFKPKIVTLGKAFLFPAVVGSLGNRGLGVTSELWWSPDYPFKSSLTGISSKQLASDYEAATKRHWTQPIPFKHALFEVVIDVLKRTKNPKDPKSILAAITSTNLDTIVGHVQWPGPVKNVCTTPVVAGQWQKKDDRLDIQIVNSGAFPDIKTTSKLLPLAAWS